MRSAGAGKYVAELIEDDLNGNNFSVEPYCDPQRFLKPWWIPMEYFWFYPGNFFLHNFFSFQLHFLCLLKYNSQDQRFSSISFFLSFDQISVPEMAICTFLYVFLDLNLYRRSVPEMNSRVCLIEITSVTIKTPPNLYVGLCIGSTGNGM